MFACLTPRPLFIVPFSYLQLSLLLNNISLWSANQSMFFQFIVPKLNAVRRNSTSTI